MIDVNLFIQQITNLSKDTNTEWFPASDTSYDESGQPFSEDYTGEVYAPAVDQEGNPDAAFVANFEDSDEMELVCILVNAVPDLLFILKDYQRLVGVEQQMIDSGAIAQS